ncbi:hypothetical protein WJX72_009494 [[Myrmecia] bisecta]|uniref:Protein phosphatase 1 regulatory subunit 11 n=1 Tax=[Myrmecia] bisecta TaxID=41462 RepID=A0AAW1Q6B5_9CHLO
MQASCTTTQTTGSVVQAGTVPADENTASTSNQQSNITEHLTLRLVPRRRKKKAVRWTDDVVDNEFMNKKKSKKCCIFHKQRQFGEWSDDDSDAECQDCNKPDQQP